LGTLLADQIGIGNALLVSALLRLIGFGLFAWRYKKTDQVPSRVGV
jgi:hypothetical protein